MRLHVVDAGQGLLGRLQLAAVRMVAGTAPLDAAKTFLYRRDFYGDHWSGMAQVALRGSSEWSVGERELFAAFTSRLNQCNYCVGVHGSVASNALGDDVLRSALDDWRSAPLRPKVRAALAFLEKMTLSPESLSPADGAALRAAGISERSIEEAIYLCWLFNVGNRVGDALGFEAPSASALAKALWFVRWRYQPF